MFIAHIRNTDKEIESVEEHLLKVKNFAEMFGSKIGVKHLAGLAGMLHDMGKYSNEFKEYILEAVNNPQAPPKRGSVDHSTAGGKLLFDNYHNTSNLLNALLAEIVGNAIISHHSYLHDFLNPNLESDFLKRVRDKNLPEYTVAKEQFFKNVMSENDFTEYVKKATNELKAFLTKKSTLSTESKLMFLTKFIFSTLIDADRTATRLFDEGKTNEKEIDTKKLFQFYYNKVLQKISSFPVTKINNLRSDLSNQCDDFAENPPGIYTLSMPTGTGKTLASLRYALKHAILKNKKRIIYVLPYTTIIEQNAEEVRKILGDAHNILEHHSNVVEDYDDDENLDGIINTSQRFKLAKDNWDSPIIFTTMVQFLNVFYAEGSRYIRRLHNLAESVIIFDEVQKVPINCVSLFNQALNFLHDFSKSTILLCTATQPALDFVDFRLTLSKNPEIIKNVDSVIEKVKRVDIVDLVSDGPLNNEQLTKFVLEKIKGVQNILVILNTKSVVKNLYNSLKNEIDIPIFHLSTSMCPAHRHDILENIRDKLKNNEKIICVSTQLIEAGVDISFNCVIRSLAGLDSIAQAAGRCNRHGDLGIQKVYVIDHADEKLDKLLEIHVGKRISKKIFTDIKQAPILYDGSILSRKAMEKYFKEFYTDMKANLNYFVPHLRINMTELLSAPRSEYQYHKAYKSKYKKTLDLCIANSYKTAAENFRAINQTTTSVLVPYGKGKDIIAELNSFHTIDDLGKLLKSAQHYTINIYKNEIEKLVKNQGIVSLMDGKIFVLKESAYDDNYGLDLDNDGSLDLLCF